MTACTLTLSPMQAFSINRSKLPLHQFTVHWITQ
jgi:hypothetical protein